MSKIKDIHKFRGGLNTDDNPGSLPPEDYTFLKNARALSSDEQHGAGLAETMQSEIEIIIGAVADINYYGEAIGGNFQYTGYEEVTIGTQTWMKRNYDAQYPGSKAYDDNELNVPLYGRLYTHHQVMSSNFCPPGWRVPTEADIDTLLTYLGGAMIAGGKLKEAGEQDWTTPNTGATDEAGFRALPGGKFDLLFDLLGDNCLLWLQDEGEPIAPVALDATLITATSFTANWDEVVGSSGYYLDVATDIAFTSMVAGYDNKDIGFFLSALVSGLDIETSYFYRVRAYNEVGSSENSNIITTETAHVVTEVGGVITIDIEDIDEFLTSVETPYIHGSTYYDGYIYGSARNPNISDGILRFLRVRAANYREATRIEIRYSSETDTQSIYYMEQLQRVGNYLYSSAYALVGAVATNLLVQIDTRNGAYKIFKITDVYGSAYAIPIVCDATHIYYIVNESSGDPDYFSTITVIKYLASDFETESWTKFNTSAYGNTGVPVAPVSTTEFLADNYYVVHAGCQDATHLYLMFNYGWIPSLAGKLLKIDKATMAITDSADIPNGSDDICQTTTHVFLGTETSIGDYESGWATVAVRKADMNVTQLLPHSTEPVNLMSYGVQILNIGGTDYLFNMRKSKKIDIIDLTNVDTWTDAGASDPEIERILSFVYSDAPVAHYILNEILIDDDEVIHVFGWAVIPELMKFKLSPL